MPLREIENRYTLSEISLMAWKSQETTHQMAEKMKPANGTHVADTSPKQSQIEQILGKPVAHDTLVDASGEFTLKKLSGSDVAKVLGSMGLPISSLE